MTSSISRISDSLVATRLGASLLTAAGCTQWIAHGAEEFGAVAATLASDIGQLAGLRQRLRDTIGVSALADVPGFTRSLEEAYRAMWQGRSKAGSD